MKAGLLISLAALSLFTFAQGSHAWPSVGLVAFPKVYGLIKVAPALATSPQAQR